MTQVQIWCKNIAKTECGQLLFWQRECTIWGIYWLLRVGLHTASTKELSLILPFSFSVCVFPPHSQIPMLYLCAILSHSKHKKKYIIIGRIKNNSCSWEGSQPECNMRVYVKLLIQLTSTKTQWSLYYGNTKERGAMFREVLMWKKMQMAWNGVCLLMSTYKPCAVALTPWPWRVLPLSLCRHTSDRVLPFSTLAGMPTRWPPSPPGWPKIPRACSCWWAWWKPPWSLRYEVKECSGWLCSLCHVNFLFPPWYGVPCITRSMASCWLEMCSHGNP